MNADIRVYPDKEMKAVDMAVTLDALEVADGVIQGCEVTLSSGALNIANGRILIKGRLGVVTTGTIETPTLAASATCRLLAVCDLAIDTPFYIALFDADEYTAISERANSVTDFNGVNGVAFVELGTADIDAGTGTVTSWTPNSDASVRRAGEKMLNRTGGSYLAAGTNIDNLTKEHAGWWVYSRADVEGTFPMTDTYGTIGHIPGTSDNIATQIIRSNAQARTNSHVFMRFKVDGTWGGWQRYASAESTALTIDLVNTQYASFDGVAFKKSGFLWLRGGMRLTFALQPSVEVHVATISGWNAPYSIYLSVANPNYANEALWVSVSPVGQVYINNWSTREITLGSRFWFTTSIPASDGYE